MKTALYFTLEEISQAKWFWSTRLELNHGEVPLKWARKVLRWWNEYRTVIKHYCRIMTREYRETQKYHPTNEAAPGAAMAIKAIWSNLRAGISIRHMLRTLVRVEKSPARWQRRTLVERDGDGNVIGRLEAIAHAKGKFALMSKRAAQTNRQHMTFNQPTI